MYRVLIVDDEEPVLDSYAFLLENATHDFSLVGKGRSGYEAIRLIHELHPDVVFMDINIPGIDGIQVIADVHEKFPGMVFILSTAYERFDLAQRAIPLGIFAYLVKPVSKKTFLSTLDSVRTSLEKRQPSMHTQSTDLAEKHFLKEVIWKQMTRDEWERYRDLFGFHSEKGLVCILEAEENAERWCRRIAEKLAFRHRCLFTMHLNRGLFLIPEDVDRQKLTERLHELSAVIIPESLVSAFAVGQVHTGPDLYKSCGEALEELHEKKSFADALIRERIRIIQIRRKIGITPIEETQALFIELWEEIFASYEFSIAKAKMAAFFTLLIDECTGCYSTHGEEETPFSPVEEIMPIADITEWIEWSTQAFKTLNELFTRQRSGNFPQPLVKAIAFINEHYAEQLQLSSVAKAAQVSSAYLSRLFSEHVMISFIDYLTELRVEKAEKLIRESSMNIKEVAFSVGYQDPNYFSKIFRKATGLPPTLYAAEKRSVTNTMNEKDGV